MKLYPRLAYEDEEEQVGDHRDVPQPERRLPPMHWAWTVAIAAAAAIPRLLYVFVFSNPENPGDGVYDDVWHHWQIAYLTKQVGLSAPGGPRLWDLKGMEYVWGPLHPLLMSAVFTITGSIDIVLDRLLSLAFGIAAVVLVFHLCRFYWGTQMGMAAALFACFLPTSVMNDASGMVEPIAVAVTLLGIWAWERGHGFWSGVGLAIAASARAEEWLFSAGLVVAALLRRAWSRHRIPLVAGFVLVMLFYVKVLLDRTGNPVYPVWWNFIGHAAGQWGTPYITQDQEAMRPIFSALLVGSLVGLAWSLWRRPKSYMLLTFGFGYWVFISGSYGFTAFLSDWHWWALMTRRFAFPWLFVAVLLTLLLLWWAPRRYGVRTLPVGWTIVAVALVSSQLAWIPIAQLFGPTEAKWHAAMADGQALGQWYNSTGSYRGHALAVPPDRPDITYGLVRYGHVDGKHLVSEMYDPFAYLPAGFRIAAHESTVSTLVQCWLADDDIKLIAVAADDAELGRVIQTNQGWFTDVGTMPDANWRVVGVNIPSPSAADCQAAKAAVT